MALVQIYTCRDAMEAHLIKGLLEERGITATVVGEALASMAGALPFASVAYPTLWVSPADQERARAFVVEFEQKRGTGMEPQAMPDWKCPNCGESIEGQFTDCWKCRAPRPGDATPEIAPSAASEARVQYDLPCVGCGYNLRSLLARQRCPECGLPLLKTMLDLLSVGASPDSQHLKELASQAFDPVAIVSGYPIEALALVCHACLRAGNGSSEPSTAFQSSTRLGEALRDLAIDHFGYLGAARAGLVELGIRHTGQVVQIMTALSDHGLLDAEPRHVVDEAVLSCVLRDLLPTNE